MDVRVAGHDEHFLVGGPALPLYLDSAHSRQWPGHRLLREHSPIYQRLTAIGELGEGLVAAIQRRGTTMSDNVDTPVLVQVDQLVQQKQLVVMRNGRVERWTASISAQTA